MKHYLHPGTGRCLGCAVAGVDPETDCPGEYGRLGTSTRYILGTDGRLSLLIGREGDETLVRLTKDETGGLRGLFAPREEPKRKGSGEYGDE